MTVRILRHLVRGTGFEPACPFERYHLKVVRLPISPPAHSAIRLRINYGTGRVCDQMDFAKTIELSDLDYDLPLERIATTRAEKSRVLYSDESKNISEIDIPQLLQKFKAGDVLVINDTKVIPARLFSLNGTEVLFIKQISDLTWQVLTPLKKWDGSELQITENLKARVLERGRPSLIELSSPLTPEDFDRLGEPPLPPYILEKRGELRARSSDLEMYQTAWASQLGSLACPTASLHFKSSDFDVLREKGVEVVRLTLHVGLGTFLPIREKNLANHTMHDEVVEIPHATWERVQLARQNQKNIWALGTTVARALESQEKSLFEKTKTAFTGSTKLFIYPPYEFQVVSRLITNFHQPQSTLLALVSALTSLEHVKKTYAWAIGQKMRFLSYGDLTVWEKIIHD